MAKRVVVPLKFSENRLLGVFIQKQLFQPFHMLATVVYVKDGRRKQETFSAKYDSELVLKLMESPTVGHFFTDEE